MKRNNKKVRKIEPALKAYDNKRFLHSRDGRIIRIMAEYLYPEQRLRRAGIKRTVIFFGSARFKAREDVMKLMNETKKQLRETKDKSERKQIEKKLDKLKLQLKLSKHYEDARKLSFLLTKWSNSLAKRDQIHISTGGGPGIMEAANRGAYEANGKSIGLNISLPFEQFPNPYIDEHLNFEFHYFFMRKFWLIYLAQIMIVFPGGFGTIDELMEILTLRQTGKMSKPKRIYLYNEKWWRRVIDFNFLAEMGVINKDDLKLFKFVNSVEQAFELIKEELTSNHLENRFKSK